MNLNKKPILTLETFTQNVKNRILEQFLKKTRTPKFSKELLVFPVYVILSPFLAYGIFNLFSMDSISSKLMVLFLGVLYFVTWFISFTYSMAHIPGYLNYQKYSDTFYGTLTSRLPI